ncbi:MAG: threonine aldolase family protein [Coprobacillaceae bacterium]
MYSFTNDYSEGAHPLILEALQKTNLEQTDGYGLDTYSQQASTKIKQLLDNENVDIHYLVGGTQTNATFIASVLRPHEAVISVDTGHINVHEAGAVEATGHKILTCPHVNGKLTVEMIEEFLRIHTDEHMVVPKMVYISQTTELGTAYTTKEIKELYTYCQQHQLYFFIDGARLGSALVIDECPSLKEITKYSDAFYIGGTKMGALLGECLVIVNEDLQDGFRYHMKQRGAMLAKGRVIGIQFLTLFENDLYLEIGNYENEMADLLRKEMKQLGYTFYVETNTNQIFPIVSNRIIKELQKSFSFIVMDKIDGTHSYIRLVTSWATKKKQIEEFVYILKKSGKDSSS